MTHPNDETGIDVALRAIATVNDIQHAIEDLEVEAQININLNSTDTHLIHDTFQFGCGMLHVIDKLQDILRDKENKA